MQEANPRLTPEQARHLTIHGSYRDEDGTYLWKFDNYVRATSPYLFNMQSTRATSGRRSPARCCCCAGPSRGRRIPRSTAAPRRSATTRSSTSRSAGHWVHHDQLAIFLKLVREFLGVA